MKNHTACAFVTGILILAALAACDTTPPPLAVVEPDVHRAAIEQWRQDRHEDLSKGDGWLSLVGLHWLKPGDTRFGAGAEAEFRYEAEGVSQLVGTFHLGDDGVEFAAAKDVDVTLDDGSAVDTITVWTADLEDAPVLHAGTMVWYVLDRGERVGVRLKDASSPTLANFEGMDNFPVTIDWRLQGRFEPHDPPLTIQVPNILGLVNDVESPGAAVFEIAGETYRLDLWKDSPDELDWFTAFGDASNVETTYGGGRFVRFDPPDEYGRLVVDFNRAYNPPCVFTPFATCPLPPRQNRLPVAVAAGERNFKAAVGEVEAAPELP